MRIGTKTLIVVSFICQLYSCKQQNSSSNHIITDDFNFIAIIGGGNEPGWNIKMVKNSSENSLIDFKFYINHMNEGKINGEVVLKKKNDTKYLFEGKETNGKLIKISFNNSGCTNMAGDLEDGEFQITREQELLIGCGTLKKLSLD